MDDPQTKPSRSRIPRFSLRTLLIFLLLLSGAARWWWHGSAWTHVLQIGSSEPSLCAAWTLDGRRVVTQIDRKPPYTGCSLQIWDGRTGSPVARIDGMVGGDRSWHLSPDSRTLLAIAGDGIASLWNLEDGSWLHRLEGNIPASGAPFYFSPSCKWIVGNANEERLLVWDVAKGMLLPDARRPPCGHFSAESFSPEKDLLVIGGNDNRALLWNLADGRCVFELAGHESEVYGALFSPDGGRMATVERKGMLRMWDARDGKCLYAIRLNEPNGAYASEATFSPQGDILVDQSLRLWDVWTGRPLGELERPLVCPKPVFSRDGRRVASGGYFSIACVWDVQSRNCLFERDQQADESMNDVELSPDGRLVITNGEIWDVATGNRSLPGFHTARFSRDGDRVLTTHGADGVRIWIKRRPDAWYGVFWLPEFYLVVLCALGLAWSVWRDARG